MRASSLKRGREFDLDQNHAAHGIATPAVRQKIFPTLANVGIFLQSQCTVNPACPTYGRFLRAVGSSED